MVIDLGHKRVVAHLRGVARRYIKIGARGQIGRPQPGDRFFVRVLARDDPKHALVGVRRESRDQTLEKLQSRYPFDVPPGKDFPEQYHRAAVGDHHVGGRERAPITFVLA